MNNKAAVQSSQVVIGDFYKAGLMEVLGHHCIGITGEKRKSFVFERTPEIERTLEDYLNGGVSIPDAREYISTLRNLKNRLKMALNSGAVQEL